MTEPRTNRRRIPAWAIVFFAVPFVYVLSSGPVLATAFWLREATGWDGFYSVMPVYYPLIVWGHDHPVHWYIEWWVKLFRTVGPG